MPIGTDDKPPRLGLYGQANQDLLTPFQTSPSAASRQTTLAMDRMLRAQSAPAGMPTAAPGPVSSLRAPSAAPAPAPAPAAAPAPGPISQMAAAAQPQPPSIVEQAAALPPAPAPQQPGAQADVRRADLAGRKALVQSVVGKDFGVPIPGVQQAAAAVPVANGMRVSNTSVAGIQRVDNAPGLKSPLFTNVDPAQAVQDMQGGTVNTMPAAAFTRGPTSPALSAALQAAAARGDWDAVRNYYQTNGGTWQGRTAEQDQEADTLKQAQALLAGQSRTGKQAGAGIIQVLMQARQAREQQANQLQAKAGEQEGQRLQNQQSQLTLGLMQKAIGGDANALKQLQAIQGKTPDDPRTKLITALAEAYVSGAAKNPLGTPVDFTSMLQQVMGAAGLQPANATPAPASIATDPRAAAIRDDKNMTRDQKVAALRQLGYQ